MVVARQQERGCGGQRLRGGGSWKCRADVRRPEASEGHCCLIRLWENEENPETSPPNSEKGWKYTRRSRGGAVGWVASLGLCRPASWTVRLSLAASQDGGSATMSSPFLKQVFNKDKTFRPKRKFEPGTQRFELHKRAQASLNAGLDLRLAVQLPPGEELNDWVAVHVVDFFNRINLIYGTISDGCTEQSCPVMSGGPKYEYRWQDEQRFRRPTALSAPRYMDQLMDWVEVQINNEDVFPTNVGTPFPKSFLQVARKILSRLFRVFVHVYIHHFDRIAQMGSEAHVNTCYKHFYYFVTEFGLIDTKELEPLKDMTARMCR
ncbi:hypothetical protein GHT09_018214 [Marmota monax]|uniref:MOB kinase activator 3A n=2 Tax=Marmota monax TaxID=9995 RepID=A0A834PKM4_MARMO|nr:hypothetical protein GHT09_018214 [Marmota monax]